MPQAVALSPGSLLGQDVITTAATPLMGYINIYNAASAPLAPILRQASLGVIGTTCLVEKDPADTSNHAVTITCYGSETFFDGTTTVRVIDEPGAFLILSIVAGSDAVARWKVVGGGSGGSGGSIIGGGWATTVTSGSAVALTVSSAHTQEFTGTTAQTVKLPSTSVLAGMEWLLINASTQTITVQSSSGGAINTLGAGRAGAYIANTNTPTNTGWDYTAASTLPVGSIVGTTDTQTLTNKAISGGTLDGCTIGATTPSPSIAAATLEQNGVGVALSGSTAQPWLNQAAWYHGSATADLDLNLLKIHDQVDTGSHFLHGLLVWSFLDAPATGSRIGIFGTVQVNSVGATTPASSEYIGIAGEAAAEGTMGGTFLAPVGNFWGGWMYGGIRGGTYFGQVYGAEINVEVQSGCSVGDKVGVNIALADNDAVRGYNFDAALIIVKQAPTSATWQKGLCFGKHSGEWGFDNTSTLICVSSPGAANIGIDLTGVTFTDAAIKVGAAHIDMAEMSSAPSQTSGHGKLYVASDGSLHYLGPTTDTQIAPA